MPYIVPKRRDDIVYCDVLDGTHIVINEIKNPGELNYAITLMCWLYLQSKGVSYTNMNEVVGVLECAKLELYRRMAAPYEDTKIEENGDVYV